MTDLEAYRMENKYPVKVLDSEAPGLRYVLDEDRRGIIISGQKGMTGLRLSQLRALCRELPGILSVYFEGNG